jgi:ribosomal protein S12 methylthiotransferase accessory factor
VLITMAERFDFSRFAAWEDWAIGRHARWALLYQTAEGGAFGPYVHAGSTPTIRDLVGRWISTAADESALRSMLKPAAHALADPGLKDASQWLISTFLTDLNRWLRGADAAGSWHHVSLSARHFTVSADPVLPMPVEGTRLRGLADPAQSRLGPGDVVNPRTGIVLRLRPVRFRVNLPPGLVYVESQTADMSRLFPWASNIYNAGSSWDDPALAEKAAVGEAIERYCGNAIDEDELIYASFDDLRRKGIPAVDPRQLTLFSSSQYATPGFPFVPFDTTTTTYWISGQSLVDGCETLVPASVAFVNWNTGRFEFDAPLHPAYYPGIAAAPSLDAAITNGIEEVIERDSVMVWWLSGHMLPTVAGPPADFVTSRLAADSPIRVQLVPIPNGCSVPTFAGVVVETSRDLCAFGLATRATPEQAATKALLEGLGLIEAAVDLQDPDGGFWHDYEALGLRQAVKPIRADRRYLDSYRADFKDVTDLWCQLQAQLDPRSRDIVTGRWSGSDAGTAWQDLRALRARAPSEYVQRATSAGFEPLYVDLTTPDARAAGWHAVRVVIPGMVPNFPTAFPPLGRDRVLSEPARLGWADRPLEERELYRFPMPYA